MNSVRIGVDIGGTHTDCVLFDSETNEIEIAKVPTTSSDLPQGVLEGLDELFGSKGESNVDFFSHGTTITTNALIERNGAKTGLLINKGFRAIQETRDQTRGYGPETYDLNFEKPPALVSQDLTHEIEGRIGKDGDILQALDEEAVRSAANQLKDQNIESIAICFLFSYQNPVHEQRAEEIIGEEYPSCAVSLSSAVFPQIREWYRMSTTLINAYLQPVLVEYTRKLEDALDGFDVAPDRKMIMKSNGGVMPFNAVESGGKTAQTLLSGPAAGVRAGSRLASVAGYTNIVTLDMGGTSADMALVEDGDPLETTSGEIGGLPMHLPMLDVEPLSAGGGTIAWIDSAGELRVGPRSAGADPGPACYDQGGSEPTITDANLVLGYLNHEYFLGGAMDLDKEKARRSLQDVSDALDLSVDDAALGVVRLIDTMMAEEIRSSAAQRELDLREFVLVAFGGAAPVHAASIADELNIPRILVPPRPGVSSALGLLSVDVMHDYSVSDLSRMDIVEPDRVNQFFWSLEEQAVDDIIDEGFDESEATIHRELDIRYAGQGHEIRVPVTNDEFTSEVLEAVRSDFDSQHRELRGHAAPEDPAEIVTYRVRIQVDVPKYSPEASDESANGSEAGSRKTRDIIWGKDSSISTPVYRRSELPIGATLDGPAIVEQPDSTTVVRPGWQADVDSFGNLIIQSD